MLRIYVGDELLEFNDEEIKHMYVNHGREAEVYRYKDEALKIYKRVVRKDTLSEAEAGELSIIKTERILMPKRMIHNYETGEFSGYSLDFISKASRKRIPRIRKEHFVEELDIIDRDLRVLANNGVKIGDLHIDNVLYNDNFYICDPGSFKIDKEEDPDILYGLNVRIFNWLLISDVFRIATKEGVVKAGIDDTKPMIDYIRETALLNERIGEYSDFER